MWVTILALVVMVGGLTLFRHYFTAPVQPRVDAKSARPDRATEDAGQQPREDDAR